MQCTACTKVVGYLNTIFGKDANLLDAYQRKFSNNGARRRKFMAMCHGLTGADLYGLAMSVIFEKNAIRPGSHKRGITFVGSHELRARLVHDPARLESTIAGGPAFTDRDTGDELYPLLKKESTPSYIYCLGIRRGISRCPMIFLHRGLTRTARYVKSARRGQSHSHRNSTCVDVGFRTGSSHTMTLLRYVRIRKSRLW